MRTGVVGLLVVVAATSPRAAAQTPRFSASEPPELQFACMTTVDATEERLGRFLLRGTLPARVGAARALWAGHSRRYARLVLAYLSGPNPGADGFDASKANVERDVQPAAILAELRTGDYRWAAWLACLCPHPDLVPPLLDALQRSEHLPETTLALGCSLDERALEPLVRLVRDGEYRAAGDAAQALGRLDLPAAERPLLEVLATGRGWARLHACHALGRVGTARALPALADIAGSNEFTGALDVKGAAAAAVKSIKKREQSPARRRTP